MELSKDNGIDYFRLNKKKMACLTLDLEQDYGDLLDKPCYDGLRHIPFLTTFLRERNIPLTCFIQGSLLEKYPEYVKQLTKLDIEFEPHSYSHPKPSQSNTKREVEKSKEVYYGYFGKKPLGYRFPLGVLKEDDYEILAINGIKYDASIFPSWRLGSFNNLQKPIQPYLINNHNIIEFPFSVISEYVRIPITLSYVKLFDGPILYLLKTLTLSNLIIVNFHLHDLSTLNSISNLSTKNMQLIYRFIFKQIYKTNKDGFALLNNIISILENRGYHFQKLCDVYEAISNESFNNNSK